MIQRHVSNTFEYIFLGNRVSTEISNFWSENSQLIEENVNPHSEKFVSHQNKTISELEALKKVLRKEAFKEGAGPDKRKEFYDTIEAISDLKAKEKFKQDLKTGAYQEKQFNKNKFKFAKEIVNGTFGKESDPTNFRMIALNGCIGKAFHLLSTSASPPS